MQIIFYVFLGFVAIWFLGVFATVYHVFSFRLPKDKTGIYLGIYLVFSTFLLFSLINWFLSAYFGA